MEPNINGSRPVGPIIGLVIVMVVIIAGAIYFAVNRDVPMKIDSTSNEENLPSNENASTTNPMVDIQNAENDLNSINTGSIDQDIQAIQ